jgi:predicted RecB family nuclease
MHKNGETWIFNTRDLMRASTCQHCTTLSVAHALRLPHVEEKLLDSIEKQKLARATGESKTLPMKYGDAYEELLVAELKANCPEGSVAAPESADDPEQTLNLLAQRVPVIYQGGLKQSEGNTVFSGRPDLLVRNDWQLEFTESGLSAHQTSGVEFEGYTAWDVKYSSHAKAEYALQVAIYVEALDQVGMKAPNAKHGLVLGRRSILELSEGEIVPAMRLARGQLVSTIDDTVRKIASNQLGSTDDFVWHCASNAECAICEYPDICQKDRVETQDLLLVAGLGKNIRAKLNKSRVVTIQHFADLAEKPAGISLQSFQKLQAQARIQLRQTNLQKPVHELLSNPTLQFLPKGSPGDVFFDMEGFPYFEDGGLEYLFGNWTRDGGFTGFWGHDREGERQAFIDFMTWLTERMDTDPNAHVYHYASYERTALRRLASRHGVMQSELYELEQQRRFVDLYPVVTKSLRVGDTGYSIKDLEKHYGFERTQIEGADVGKATDSIDGYDYWVIENRAADDPALLEADRVVARKKANLMIQALENYNTDDVKSTMALFDWLSSMPGASTKEPVEFEITDEAQKRIDELREKLAALEEITKNLLKPVEHWPRGEDPEKDKWAKAWELLVHSLLFYEREDLMARVDLLIKLGLEDSELLQDKAALPITEFEILDASTERARTNYTWWYRAALPEDCVYQPKVGDSLKIRYTVDGFLNQRHSGQVVEVTDQTVTFKRSSPLLETLAFSPTAIIAHTTYPTQGKIESLEILIKQITTAWGHPGNEPPRGFAALDLILQREPSLISGELVEADTSDYLPALIETVLKLDSTTLAVQGPPGTGKTYLASRLIKELIDQGKRVCVTSNSHAAVENLLKACLDAELESEQIFKSPKTGQPASKLWQNKVSQAPTVGPVVMGATSFGMANKEAKTHHFDYMIVDEAAQFSLVDTIAGSLIADNIVLFGDPQQLAQVVQARHPGGVEVSALGQFMGDHQLLPGNMGYFVEETRRLHPKVTEVISWLSYENRLRSHKDTHVNVISGTEPGVYKIELDHSGNQTSSPEEVATVVELVNRHFKDLGAEEILIVAPYNAQVNLIRRALDDNGFEDVRVGTVDKFQGQEGKVVIYSFGASSAEDAPRGLGFLLDQNRMNVAISRAKSVCYLVYSKQLPQANFRSIEDVKSISRLAGVLDMAKLLSL